MTITIHDLDAVDAVVEPYDWAFPVAHHDAIEAYWEQTAAGRPGFFNGTVLVQHRGIIEGRVFRAGYSTAEYKHFLGYLRLEHPMRDVRNGFGMAALRAADGAFLLGEMGPDTANAGMIYFAAGTPDLGDVTDGRLDLGASVIREMCEETGLAPGDVTIADGWTCLLFDRRAAFMRRVTIDLPADEARRLMLDRMKALHEDELSDIVIIRPGFDAADPRMPAYMARYMEREFARG